MRSLFYGLARLLGDLTAIRKGRVGQRVFNRVVGRGLGRVGSRFYR